MNTNKLKKFASKSRELLINEVTKNIKYLEVRDANKLPSFYQNGVQVNDVSFNEGKKAEQRKNLIARVSEIGEEQIIEEIAYLWFNRFVALRYMEVNNYLSYGSKVVSSDDNNKLEPDIVKNATHLIGLNLDNNIIYDFLDKSDKDSLYKYLIINICNSLHSELPFMFEKISDYSELLFPESLLEKGSFLDLLVNEVDEEDWKEVEILGWLYQYYISDKKDILINAKKKYKKSDVPAVTQLFTSKWIVKYMVENSIGKMWLESHPNKELQSKWEYYIESETVGEINPSLKPEEITVLDPAMGSGHILVYAFELLFDIYKSAGYSIDEIPKLIIENNLYGLEIDDRAWQIACFSIMMKARKYDKKILKQGIVPNVCSIQESTECDKIDELKYPNLAKLCISFKQGKLLGSLITLKEFDLEKVNSEFEKLQSENSIFNVHLIKRLPDIIKQANLIYQKYSCVVSNPPYMGSKYMNDELSDFVKKNYPNNKGDLFACFMERNFIFTKQDGFLGFMTPFVWMFIQSYQDLREYIIENKTISSLVQLEYNAFENACIPICTFVLRNYNSDIKGDYIKLSDFRGSENQPIKTLEAIKNPNVNYRYKFNTNNFSSIPGSPIAYWVSEKVREIFEKGEKIGKNYGAVVGMMTGDNELYLKIWFELNFKDIGIELDSKNEVIANNFKYIPYNKAGGGKRWFGYNEYVLYSEKVKEHPVFFKNTISWSDVTSGKLSGRFYPKGFAYDISGHSLFTDKKEILFGILAFLNLKFTNEISKMLNPTLHFQIGNFNSLPFLSDFINNFFVTKLTQENIYISKEEWDSRETSWDFSKNELLKHKTDSTLENAYNTYCKYWEEKFFTQHKNEEELNRLFIEIYGLQDEMTPEVNLEDITLLKDETKIVDNKLVFQKDEIIKQFISYAVGCMMGRYSLDNEGLAFAGGDFDSSKYLSFKADEDGIITVLSDEYFEDDIVARFREFVKLSFGEEKLNANLDFIANALIKKTGESSLDRIRRYFANEFYKDHVDRYKKRPIYWLFTSGKDKTFNTLVYLHRYDKSTLSKIRMDYLHKLQGNIEGQRRQVESSLVGAEGKTKLDLEKQKNELLKKVDALKHYDEKLKHLAEQKIELDLDDGVKVNYPKLGELLEVIKL